MSADVQSFKNVMSRWPSGVSVITTVHEGEWHGFTANSFASVSIEPMLISMSMAKTLHTGTLILTSRIFTVNILRQEQAHLGQRFAGMIPEYKERRFEGLNITLTETGCPLLPDTLGWMSCRVYQAIDVGASTLILGEVIDCYAAEAGEPLLYYRRQWGQFSPFSA
ncbi:MAG: flavin reductase family protein [Anaerolineae bacterium]|jgi:flavin reductase (DIM6/NTAB) family NADH-FMN oxidoreductase RutF|nr:flavin reductase family protein [Anaerolineae bacterium]